MNIRVTWQGISYKSACSELQGYMKFDLML